MESYSTEPDKPITAAQLFDDAINNYHIAGWKIPASHIDWRRMPWTGCWRLFGVQVIATAIGAYLGCALWSMACLAFGWVF